MHTGRFDFIFSYTSKSYTISELLYYCRPVEKSEEHLDFENIFSFCIHSLRVLYVIGNEKTWSISPYVYNGGTLFSSFFISNPTDNILYNIENNDFDRTKT